MAAPVRGNERLLAAWRRRLQARRAVHDHVIDVPGARARYVIAAPADPDAVLDELATPDPHMPYWATPWPSGLALAESLLARPHELRDRQALELGCGLGITAIALVQAGARLAVADCFAEALAYCQYNVRRNTGLTPRRVLADWREAGGQARLLRAGPVDILVAADVLYEAEDVAPLLALSRQVLAAGGTFWLAEPGRATSARFLASAHAAGWHGDTDVVERVWPAGAGYARVRIHRLTIR